MMHRFIIDPFQERSPHMRNLKTKLTWISPILIAYVLLIGLLGLSPSPALADAAPPWTAQGGAVTPGEEPTHVTMISETVTLIVEPLVPADPDTARADERMVAHVEATFLMHNQGTETEALDVWFPTTSRDDYGWDFSYPDPIETFRAWVNGEPAEVAEAPGQDSHATTWATWPVTFPPGEDVRLRVTYDTHPIGWGPWGSLPYVLETGAGWRGPIGEGTITFRLPYEVTPMNVQLAEIREAYTGPDRPFEIIVDGTDVSWHFTDLEPERSEHPWSMTGRETDNPTLTLLAPAVWAEIEAAQAHAEAHPDSVEAHLRLAEALERGTYRKAAIFYNEANTLLIERTDVAYRRALELAPDDLDTLVAYLEWLGIQREQPWGGTMLGEGLDDALSRALALDPDHPRVLEIEEWVEHWRQEVAPHMPQPPTPTVPASPTPTASPEPTATPQPSPSPTQTPTPTETPLPTATATPTSTAGQSAGITIRGGILLGVVVLMGVLVVFWLAQR